MNQKLDHILNYTALQLKDRLSTLGFKSFLANQVYDWVYKKMKMDQIDSWSNVSKQAREELPKIFSFNHLKLLTKQVSSQGTVKFLLGLSDGQSIETVLIQGKDRLTLCISTQVGCAIGCTFCHTATQGLKRNLEVFEIVGQFYFVKKWVEDNNYGNLTNIVYMGQGEPLHNFENTKNATLIFMSEKGLNIGQRKITLSTSGLIPQLEKFIDFPPINLAISLHAAFDDKRSALMPINKNYNLEDLLRTLDKIPLKAHRRITYEYLLIKDFNDTIEDVDELVKLLKRARAKINLIPFNEYPGTQYRRPSDEKIHWFTNEIIKKGFTCTIRHSKGDDILAACGQLKSSEDNKKNKINPFYKQIENSLELN